MDAAYAPGLAFSCADRVKMVDAFFGGHGSAVLRLAWRVDGQFYLRQRNWRNDGKVKTKLGIVVGLISVMLSPTDFANAQAPSSIAGVGILASISDGIYPYASYGYAIQLFANSGN